MNILQLFKKYALETPHKNAIVDDKNRFTYYEVDLLSDYIAYKIKKDINKSTRIMLELKHSPRIIIAILGVLKSGNTFVPVSYDIQKEKKQFICKNSECEFLITDNINSEIELASLYVDNELFKNVISSDKTIKNYFIPETDFPDTPYILYTSGSTGMPKGVRVSKENLTYILTNMQEICPITTDSTYSFSTPYTFDVSMTEIFGWIIGNGSVAVWDLSDFSKFKEFISLVKEYSITHFASSPSALNIILDMCSDDDIEVFSENIKYLMIAGEKFNRNVAVKWENSKIKSRLFNFYGPTEATIYATYYEIKRPLPEGDIPIGKPLNGADYLIQKNNGDLNGELIILGEGVSKGYVDNQELTDKCFGIHENGVPFYKTGDIVSLDDNNDIVFIGRKDQQIQIHGIRVELGEIEFYLNMQPEIENSVVIYSDNKLYAFLLTEDNKKIDVSVLRKTLENKIPRYMIPHSYYSLDAFPLTESKKINRKQLLQYLKEKTNNKKYNEHLTSTEKTVRNVITTVLEIPENEISVNDDFFEKGGDSLSVVSSLITLEDIYKREFDTTLFYAYRTIKKIASKIDSLNSNETDYSKEAYDLINNEDKDELKVKLDNFTNSIKNMESQKTYVSSYIERLYYYKKTKNFIYFHQIVDTTFSEEQIKEAIKELICVNPLFRSSLYEKEGELCYREFNQNDIHLQVPVIKFSNNISTTEFEANFNSIASNILFQSRYNKGLLYSLCVLKLEKYSVVYFALDHCIADGSCISLICRDFGQALSGQSVKKIGIPYEQYCKYVDEANNIDKIRKHWYINKLENTKINAKSLLSSFEMGTNHICIKNLNSIDSDYISTLSAYFVCKAICEKSNESQISINVHYNIRKFGSINVEDTIGDLHSTVPFIFESKDNFEDFTKECNSIKDDLFSSKLFSPRHVIFKSYPNLDNQQQRLREITGSNIPITLSFQGMVSDSELNEYNIKMVKIHEKLRNEADLEKIYVTVISNNNDLHLYLDRRVWNSDCEFEAKDIQ